MKSDKLYLKLQDLTTELNSIVDKLSDKDSQEDKDELLKILSEIDKVEEKIHEYKNTYDLYEGDFDVEVPVGKEIEDIDDEEYYNIWQDSGRDSADEKGFKNLDSKKPSSELSRFFSDNEEFSYLDSPEEFFEKGLDEVYPRAAREAAKALIISNENKFHELGLDKKYPEVDMEHDEMKYLHKDNDASDHLKSLATYLDRIGYEKYSNEVANLIKK